MEEENINPHDCSGTRPKDQSPEVNNYIVKPFTPMTLKQKLEATLQQCGKS